MAPFYLSLINWALYYVALQHRSIHLSARSILAHNKYEIKQCGWINDVHLPIHVVHPLKQQAWCEDPYCLV